MTNPSPPTQPRYQYKGQLRSGAGVTGTAEGSVSEFVSRKYAARWPYLTVEREGEKVGGIEQVDGKRIWWAENDD